MPDLDCIQAIIVARAPEPVTALLAFRFGAADGARGFLRHVLERTPDAASAAAREPWVLHPSFSWHGIELLVAGSADLDPAEGRELLEPFFVAPLPSHPGELGFVGPSAPERWWDGAWSSADLDCVVMVLASDGAALEEAIGDVRAAAAAGSLEELRVPSFPGGAMAGCRPQGGILHFGYRDGITRPDIDWAGDGGGSVDFREILLGYPDETYPTSPVAPGPWREFVRDGSIGCVTWIEQHVHAFARFLREEGAALAGRVGAGLEEEWLASRLVGRWRDGSPTIRWPDAPPGAPDHQDDFGFAADPEGVDCPLAAHIRIVNPRDDRLKAALRAKFPKGPPQLVRRGFTYGPPMSGPDEDGIGRGLVGIFFGARLNEQHRSILRWMQETTINDRFGQAPYTRRMQDSLCGARGKERADVRHAMSVGPEATVYVALPDFITYRGVAHVLTPSLPSLRRLGMGAPI